jgi:hypothetical protein
MRSGSRHKGSTERRLDSGALWWTRLSVSVFIGGAAAVLFPLRVITVSTSLSPSRGWEEFWLGKTCTQLADVVRRLMFCGLRLQPRWASRMAAQALDNASDSLCDLDQLEAHVGERMVGPKLSLWPCDRRGLWVGPLLFQICFKISSFLNWFSIFWKPEI